MAVAAALEEELPELTAQQMHFVDEILAGRNSSDAYRAAYDTSTMTSRTINAAACRLASQSNIRAWLSACRKAYLSSGAVTVESHMRELDRLKELALESGNHGAAIQAEQLRGKASGLYIDRFEDVTPPDPARLLSEVMRVSPQLAHVMASRIAAGEKATALPVIEAESTAVESTPVDATDD